MEGWMDGRTDGGICRLDEWAGCRSDYRRIPQDTACYPWMMQDTFIDACTFNRKT